MKNVRMLEVTLEELNGVEPQPGGDITYRAERYHVLEVTPPVVKPSKWRRPAQPVTPKWRLLVERFLEFDWHYIPKELYAAELEAREGQATDADIDRRYRRFLAEVRLGK